MGRAVAVWKHELVVTTDENLLGFEQCRDYSGLLTDEAKIMHHDGACTKLCLDW